MLVDELDIHVSNEHLYSIKREELQKFLKDRVMSAYRLQLVPLHTGFFIHMYLRY